MEINETNYTSLIKEIKVSKKNNILICIPTFNSFEVTSETIKKYLDQQDVQFDLMVVGASGDIERLQNSFKQINFCLTKGNYGSAGNFLISIYISKNYNYEYALLSDNDAFIVENDGLKKMLNTLKQNQFYVTYPNNYLYKKVQNDSFIPFHCCLYDCRVFSLLKRYFNSEYFLTHDDTSFRFNLLEYNKFIIGTNVNYHHPVKVYMFSNKYCYYLSRSFTIFLFKEKFQLKFKIQSSSYLLPYMFFIALQTICFFDFTRLKMFWIGIKDGLTGNLKTTNFPSNKFNYHEIDYEERKFVNKNSLMVFFTPKYIYTDNLDGTKKYFKRS